MNILLLVLIVMAVFATLLFIEAFRIKLVLDTERETMNMTILWLYPFIKVMVTIEDTKPVLKLFIFKKLLFSRIVKKKKRKHSELELVKITNPKDIYINANYGFSNPFTTGIACGAINIAQQFINIKSFKNNPDFTTAYDYIYFDATAKVNLGQAFINFLRLKKS